MENSHETSTGGLEYVEVTHGDHGYVLRVEGADNHINGLRADSISVNGLDVRIEKDSFAVFRDDDGGIGVTITTTGEARIKT